MNNYQTFQRMRTYLHSVLQDGDLRRHPALGDVVEAALDSADPEWIPEVYHWARIQHVPARPESDPDEPLFREPSPNRLGGDIYIGPTQQSGHPVFLPPQSFGQRGHVLFTGATGTGKSTALNFISLQLMERVPVMVYDTLNQTAPLLVPHLPAENLNVLDFRDYRRNILTGPPGMSQLDWIRAAVHHLMESLDIQPVTMNVLVRLCEEIVADGQVATLPRLLERLKRPGHQTPPHRALQNRLLAILMTGQDVFGCERGFDLGQLFRRSCVFNLKGVSPQLRKLIYYDHYAYLTHLRPVLARWRLRTCFVFHEAASLVSRGAVGKNPLGESYFLSMIREARNYGIGFLFADQVPHFEHTVVRSNIGTKGIFRLEDEAAVESFRTALRLDDRQKNAVLNLPDRHLLLRRPDIPFPFLVRVPRLY